MSNAFSLKAGIYCCLFIFFVGCQSDKPHLSEVSVKAEFENYQQRFLHSDEELRSVLEAVRPLAAAPTLDSSQLVMFKSIDKKTTFYKNLVTEKLSKYNVLIQKSEAGQVTQEEIKKYRNDYVLDFKHIEDAYQQMTTTLKEIQGKHTH